MNKLQELTSLHQQLLNAQSTHLKLLITSAHLETVEYLHTSPKLVKFLKKCNEEQQFVIQSVLAIGQGRIVFQDIENMLDFEVSMQKLTQTLLELEKFYDFMGGIVGYHLTVLTLMLANTETIAFKKTYSETLYEKPEGIDVSRSTPEVHKIVRWGIEHLDQMAEIYPLGGSGDRLNLHDELTGEDLPAAQMIFYGRTLFEGLIRDLQGREYLYYKFFGKQIATPIAIMTSHEKNNRQWIEYICESTKWFNRHKASFNIFNQILVPMITVDGNWAMESPLHLMLKPGGHGAIWKAAQDAGVLDWLIKSSHNRAVVRQINNPVAGQDNGLLALIGIGCQKNKAFGFASCERLLNVAEGMNVLRESKENSHYKYCITNVEYTDFKKLGIDDTPKEPGSIYSRFPANTNILFVDLNALEIAMKQCSLPGLIVNMKNKIKCLSKDGQYQEQIATRLESTMQNIADYIIDEEESPLEDRNQQNLKTFLTYNDRKKTISVVKQLYSPGYSLIGTPEGCFYELMQNYRNLFTHYCQVKLPDHQNQETYLKNGPNFTINFHPALGTLYSIIGQKIQGGQIHEGSEWIMEIAEAEILNLDLKGSLVIIAENIMGTVNESGTIDYDTLKNGKCTLLNVKVNNKGSHPTTLKDILNGDVKRLESLSIKLHGNAEFHAENVIIEGNFHFDVPDGNRLMLSQHEGKLSWHLKKIKRSTWAWGYQFNDDNSIALNKISL